PPGGGTGLVAQSARNLGLDLRSDDLAFASVRVNGSTNLYRINRDTGAAALAGAIGDGSDTVRDIVLGQPSFFRFVSPQDSFSGEGPVYNASEADGAVVLTVERSGDKAGAISVDYVITGGTATAGADYTGPTSGTVTFADGETTRTVTIPLVRD